MVVNEKNITLWYKTRGSFNEGSQAELIPLPGN